MKLKYTGKQEVAKDTTSYFFQTEKPITWLPGQYYYFTLPKLTMDDPKGATRHFTIHLSPTEVLPGDAGKTIGFTTRVRNDSGYKQTFDKLAVGTELQGEGAEGTFILDENEKGEHVLLAGGIGITPFRSFIKYNVDKQLENIKLHLIYANSTPDIPFKNELDAWAKQAGNITVDYTVSEPTKAWKGLKGRIDAAMIKQIIVNRKLKIENCTFWVCGPPPMTKATEQILGELGIKSNKLRSEKFTGY